MSDSDSIRTDKSQTDLQLKYDKLAMEFAKARMQLNVLKKAYTAKSSKSSQRSNESLDQFDTISARSLDLQDDFNKPGQINLKVVNAVEEFKSKDVQLLKQDINSINHYIRRVLDCTKSNQLDYNLIMSEIEYCKGVQNNCSNNVYDVLNNEMLTLKCSVTACLYNLLYQKLESRTKINSEDSRLIYPNHYCLDSNYKTDEDRFQKVFVTLVIHFFLSFIVNLHNILEYLLKIINPEESTVLQKSLKSLTNVTQNNSLILDKVLTYCEDLKTLKIDSQNILMKNILLFVTDKYIGFVECMNDVMKSDTTEQFDCSSLRRNIISFMALKFPVEELVNSSEHWDSSMLINEKLNSVHDTVHTLLRAINILEFEYFYKSSQLDMHWHMENSLQHLKYTKQAKKELNSAAISQKNYEKMLYIYNEKLNHEMNRSLSFEQEKIHWENEYKLLCKKNESVSSKIINFNDNPESLEPYTIENQVGICQSNMQLKDEVVEREKELKRYFEKKMNNLLSKNKELTSQNNAYLIENTALKTQLDHSIIVRYEIEVKLQDALEQIDDLKEELHLTSTNYETQLRAMTEHLASLNETIVLERKHIDELNLQLKKKDDKKKSFK